ncbi:Serine/threonine-protein phosphatase [Aphelenchoides besseyi]|nr:Serine/threonine-protein phosphatase [Aphelenchoides besseyi]KAI6221181.1 Serine/threonine-protein phosphatase [Aphelenchoides besseyi]
MKRNWDGELLAKLDVSLIAEEIYKFCAIAVESFKQQPALLRISSTSKLLLLTMIADLHGQLGDVRLIFEHLGHVNQRNFLFLGDYADREVQGVEVIRFLLVNKIRFLSKYFVLRVNHKDYNISMVYGLLDECLMKYEEKICQRVWLSLVNVFNYMLFAALIVEKIYATHGGISPEVDLLEDINRIVRPCPIPLYGLACDIVWSDPITQYDVALSVHFVSFTTQTSPANRSVKTCRQIASSKVVFKTLSSQQNVEQYITTCKIPTVEHKRYGRDVKEFQFMSMKHQHKHYAENIVTWNKLSGQEIDMVEKCRSSLINSQWRQGHRILRLSTWMVKLKG